MNIDPSTRDRAESLFVEFINLMRVRIAASSLPPGVKSDAEKMWDEIYGSVGIAGQSYEDVLKQISQIVAEKINAASAVAVMLALRLSRIEERPVAEVLDDVEQRLRELGEGLS